MSRWQDPQWCEAEACVLPAGHRVPCWDGHLCESCPGNCPCCDGRATCPCINDHSEDDV